MTTYTNRKTNHTVKLVGSDKAKFFTVYGPEEWERTDIPQAHISTKGGNTMSNLPAYSSLPALTPHVPAVSMRDKIADILYGGMYSSCGEALPGRDWIDSAVDEILGTFTVTERK
jgi:hypothetical protein